MITDEMMTTAVAAYVKVDKKCRPAAMRAALEAALSAAEPKPMPSVAVENLITEVHDAIDEYREGMKGDKFGPHEWPTVDGIKTTVAQALRRSALSAQVQDVTGWQPIETAPRDGTQFLALLSNGWYELLRSPKIDAGDRYCWWSGLGRLSIPIVETHPKNMDWEKIRIILATHWMPLPAAPAKQD